MEDWMLPSPSPRTLMTSIFNEDFSSGPPFSRNVIDSNRENVQDTNAPLLLEPNLFGTNQKSNTHGGLADRMAARAGFRVLKIDTSRVSSAAPIRSPVTLPPGVSPRELLESPVFLPNAVAQPSPTTGKLPFLMPDSFESVVSSVPNKAEDRTRNDCAFYFQPKPRSKAPSFSTAGKGLNVVNQNQSAINDNQQELSLQPNSIATKDETEANLIKPKTCDLMLENYHPSLADESEEIENGEYSSVRAIDPAEDGYNWRKYGQKQMKNSEHPRSYYKCTHPNCPVKKKVERSQDGHITEIVYKGSHNHPLPPPNCPRSAVNDLQAVGSENFGSKPGHCNETSRGMSTNDQFQDVQSGVSETKLSGSLTTTEIADACVMESQEVVGVSSTVSSSEKDERATPGAIPSTYDRDEDETQTKRRKMDVSANLNTTSSSTIDMAAMQSRPVREPRIVVQTTSEVDILDDGYRWRKYGQKVVKGNPNPRSYYKCTFAGCSVRKHVERASNDLKSVITTYEGKHNHEVPAARNSGGHPGSGAAPLAGGLHRRPEPAQASVPSYASVCLPPPPQLSAASGGFSFGMLPLPLPPGPGMVVPPPPVPSLEAYAPVQVPGHPQIMQVCAGHMLPRGQVKVIPEEQSRLPVTNGTAAAAAAYHQQLTSWLSQSQGHQM